MSADENCYLLLSENLSIGTNTDVNEGELIKSLEKGDDETKIETLKEIILYILNGEQLPRLLMTVIKFCLHSANHTVKKLLYLYWEVVNKKDSKTNELLPEMILVCNAMKKDLQHPNEYIKGSTLRFLCKMKEREILESLIPHITANLEHRHSYVRKNAVLTVFSIYETFPDMIEDAPELMYNFLQNEANPAAKRNAFLMLYHCDQDRAILYLDSVLQTIGNTGEAFQLVCLDLIRRVCKYNPSARARYIRCIHTLLTGNSNAVAFEGANTLVALSSKPTAVRATVTAYCKLLQAESDNNIKVIILNQLSKLKNKNKKILQEMLMDILRTLSSPSLDIRKKTLDLTLDLVTSRNIESVVLLLKKEMKKIDSQSTGKYTANANKYRKLIVDVLHKFSIKFPDVVSTIVHMLLNYLGNNDDKAAREVIYFIREVANQYHDLRPLILSKLLQSFDEIRDSEVYRIALWIISQYLNDNESIEQAFQVIFDTIGPLPFIKKKNDDQLESAAAQ